MTKSVKFYEWNHTENEKKFLTEVPIEAIANNAYCLNYTEYIEKPATKVGKKSSKKNNIMMKKISEICDINYGTRIVRKNNTEGEYPVYGSGRATFTTDSYNREGYNILIGRFALSQECENNK